MGKNSQYYIQTKTTAKKNINVITYNFISHNNIKWENCLGVVFTDRARVMVGLNTTKSSRFLDFCGLIVLLIENP